MRLYRFGLVALWLYRHLGTVMDIANVMTAAIMTIIAVIPADTAIPVAISSLSLFYLARNCG